MRAKELTVAIVSVGLVLGSATHWAAGFQEGPSGADQFTTNEMSAAVDEDEYESILQLVEEELDEGATSLVVGASPEQAPVAAALAGNLEAPVLLGDPAIDDVIDLVDAHSVADLYLVAYDDTFDGDTLDTLEAAVSDLHTAFGATSLEVAAATLDLHPDNADTIAFTPDDGSEVRATTWSLARGLPVVTYAEDEPESSFDSLSGAYPSGTIMIFGDVEQIPAGFAGLEWEGEASTYDAEKRADPWLDDIVAAIEVGRAPTNLVAAPQEQPFVTQQAAALAAQEGGVFQAVVADAGFGTDTDARRTLELVGDEVGSVRVVGAGVPDDAVDDLLDAAIERRAAEPDAYVSEMIVSDDSASLEIDAPSSVETIEAYDITGELFGTTTSSTLDLEGEPQALQLALLDSGGGDIGSIEFKTNFTEGGDSSFDVAASEHDGRFHIEMDVEEDSPRLVIAHGRSLEDDSVEAYPVAVTCESAVSFDVPDATLEWQIESHDFSGGQAHPACGENSPVAPALLVAGASFPPTEFLGETRGPNGTLSDARGAQPTSFDQLLMTSDGTAENSAASIPPVYLRYETFIEPEFVYTPSPTIGALWRFNGDNRTVGQPGDVKVLVDSRIQFDGSAPSRSVEIGETSRWTCRLIAPWPGCSDLVTETSSGESVTVTGSTTTISADVNVSIAEPNPLFPLAPNLDADAQFTLRLGGSTVSVEHDRMPTHAVWFGAAESHYYLVYVSASYSLECLAGILPNCTVNTRVAF